MKKWVRYSLITATAVLALAAAAVAWAVYRGDSKMQRQVQQPAYALALTAEAGRIERGRYLYNSRGCADCHGAGGAGHVFIDDAKIGMKVAGPNISPGPGNVVAAYQGADWDRALRHGIKPDGRPLMVMPSEEYARLTDDDVAAIAAFVRQLPPLPGGPAVMQLPLPVRAMYGLGLIQDAAEKIDHRLPPQQPVPEGVTLAHGQYVANGCTGCHGAQFAGGKIAGAPPDWPAAARLAAGEGSAMPRYTSAAEFKAMLRSGKRPDGSEVSKVMPFAALSQMNDVDVEAMYLYLRSLPATAR